jgi:vitamin K-dependent gamma-carboxylase
MLLDARNFLGTQIDNSPLVLFRMFFGFLAAAETIGAIFTGWVDRTLIQPKMTFTFIGFEWLQPLEGNGMIIYFIVMGMAALMIMLGLFYRFSSFLFFIMWTGVYLMQKSEYNNHYYLLVLLSAVMVIMPANKSRSLDVKFGFTKSSDTCARAWVWFFILQVMIVYVSASLNKIHPDWLAAKPIGIWFQYKSNYWMIGSLLGKEWFQYVIAWGGVFYDGLIVFLLLYKPTRKLGFGLSIFFNLFNAAVFQIGIFPFLMIAFTVFFFPPETIRSIFFKKKTVVEPIIQPLSVKWSIAFAVYFIIQLALPLRHHLYKGDVHFTEEGHRMAWQMMLRAKSSTVKMEVVDEAGNKTKIKLSDYLTYNQINSMAGQPDMIWQFAQFLKREYASKGESISVFAEANVSLNGHPFQKLVNPDVNLAAVPWDRWKHSEWILLNSD